MTQRRSVGGARREATARVSLVFGGASLEGWSLNVSRGGVRIVIDGALDVGSEGTIALGDESPRAARVVWVREESDGQIVGLEFVAAKAS